MAAIRRVLPLLNRVLVQRVEAPKKSAGGILLPETKESDLQVATVIATGPGHHDERGNFQAVAVKVGQKVLLPPYGGTNVEVQDQKYYIYKDSEILAVVEDN
jgi:chaperonin GroES